MSSRVFMSTPDVGALEEEFVLNALRSGWVAPLGPDVDAFESELAERVGGGHAVALSSGTAALHLGMVAWGIGPGTVVPTSTMTFAATANAIAYTGAEPFFIDADPATGNIDPNLLEEAVRGLRAQGRDIGAVVPVDLLGKTCDYEALAAIGERHEVRIFVDAAESLGAKRHGTPAGAYGDAAIFSFNGNKIMTTSGGGMFLSQDKALADRVRYLSTQARQPVVHYEHTEVGYNYRMSNILAALGRAQLRRLDDMIARRGAHRARYKEFFSPVEGVEVFGGRNDSEDNFWLTSILVDPDRAGWSAEELRLKLAEEEIETRPLWKPMHLQPAYRDAQSLVNGTSERLFNTGLTLPSGSALTEEETDRVFGALASFLESR